MNENLPQMAPSGIHDSYVHPEYARGYLDGAHDQLVDAQRSIEAIAVPGELLRPSPFFAREFKREALDALRQLGEAGDVQVCGYCHREAWGVWHADDTLYAEVTEGIISCPECFTALCRRQGIKLVWRPVRDAESVTTAGDWAW